MTELLNSPWLFIPFFIVMWCFICLIISRLSGWDTLATFYGTSEKAKGRKFSFQSIFLGRGSLLGGKYGSCVTAHLSNETLYLQVWPLFRFGHAKLSIPLIEMEAEASRFLFFKIVNVRFKRTGNLQMRVFTGLGKDILRLKAQTKTDQSS